MRSGKRMPVPDDPAQATETRATPGNEPWTTTRVSKTLWPPQAGTKRLRDRYGAALVCVRYRHDAEGRHRYTTVELMVDHGPVRTPRGGRRIYELDVPYWNETLRRELLNAGAVWDKDATVWRLSLSMAKALGVVKRLRRAKAGGAA